MAIRFAICALCTAAVFSEADAASQQKPITALVLGTGFQSCANWLSTPEYERDGNEWILGYWSAVNLLNENHGVGRNTEGPGIIGEVRKVCVAEPSTRLSDAVARVYRNLAKAGK